jgi:hypothetical protein
VERGEVDSLIVEAVARYDLSDDASYGLFDDACCRLAPEGAAALDGSLPYLRGTSRRERCAGAMLVGRIGEQSSEPLKQRAYDSLFAVLLVEHDDEVRDALAAGINLTWLTQTDDRSVLAMVEHPNPNARFAAALSLGLTTTDAPEDADKRAALERLTNDPDEGVRGWAEFGLDTLAL